MKQCRPERGGCKSRLAFLTSTSANAMHRKALCSRSQMGMPRVLNHKLKTCSSICVRILRSVSAVSHAHVHVAIQLCSCPSMPTKVAVGRVLIECEGLELNWEGSMRSLTVKLHEFGWRDLRVKSLILQTWPNWAFDNGGG